MATIKAFAARQQPEGTTWHEVALAHLEALFPDDFEERAYKIRDTIDRYASRRADRAALQSACLQILDLRRREQLMTHHQSGARAGRKMREDAAKDVAKALESVEAWHNAQWDTTADRAQVLKELRRLPRRSETEAERGWLAKRLNDLDTMQREADEDEPTGRAVRMLRELLPVLRADDDPLDAKHRRGSSGNPVNKITGKTSKELLRRAGVTNPADRKDLIAAMCGRHWNLTS